MGGGLLTEPSPPRSGDLRRTMGRSPFHPDDPLFCSLKRGLLGCTDQSSVHPSDPCSCAEERPTSSLPAHPSQNSCLAKIVDFGLDRSPRPSLRWIPPPLSVEFSPSVVLPQRNHSANTVLHLGMLHLALLLQPQRKKAEAKPPLTNPPLIRFTPHLSRLTPHVSRFTFHVSRLTPPQHNASDTPAPSPSRCPSPPPGSAHQ